MDGKGTRSDASHHLDRSRTTPRHPDPDRPSLVDQLVDRDDACACIADVLVELARRGEFESGLSEILDGLDRGIDELEREARERAERIHDALFAHSLRRGVRADARRLHGVDPHYWG